MIKLEVERPFSPQVEAEVVCKEESRLARSVEELVLFWIPALLRQGFEGQAFAGMTTHALPGGLKGVIPVETGIQ